MAAPPLHLIQAGHRAVAAAASCRNKVDLFAEGSAAVLLERLASAEAIEEKLHAFAGLPEVYRGYEYDAVRVTDFFLQSSETIFDYALCGSSAASPSIIANKARF
jgi:hypothetical protein